MSEKVFSPHTQEENKYLFLCAYFLHIGLVRFAIVVDVCLLVLVHDWRKSITQHKVSQVWHRSNITSTTE